MQNPHMRNEAQTEKAQDDEIERYRKASKTIDYCVEDCVNRILPFFRKTLSGDVYHLVEEYVSDQVSKLAEDVVDAYTGNLELEEEV